MHSEKVIPTPRRPNDETDSQCSIQTDLSDVGLCSLNMGQFKKALEKCAFMIETVPHNYLNQLWLIRAILNNIDEKKDLAKDDFQRALKYDPENTKRLIQEQKQIKLDIFPQQQRLCTQLPRFALNFGNLNFPPILVRLSFSFPFIKPPNMIPSVDQAVLQDFVEKLIIPKIEAPWIKRCDYGIKFTDQIYFIENQPVFSENGNKEQDDDDQQSKPMKVERNTHKSKRVGVEKSYQDQQQQQYPRPIKRHSSQPVSSSQYTRIQSQLAQLQDQYQVKKDYARQKAVAFRFEEEEEQQKRHFQQQLSLQQQKILAYGEKIGISTTNQEIGRPSMLLTSQDQSRQNLQTFQNPEEYLKDNTYFDKKGKNKYFQQKDNDDGEDDEDDDQDDEDDDDDDDDERLQNNSNESGIFSSRNKMANFVIDK